ncbi:hypothetical protein D3C84_1126190 [compost metagenome]
MTKELNLLHIFFLKNQRFLFVFRQMKDPLSAAVLHEAHQLIAELQVHEAPIFLANLLDYRAAKSLGLHVRHLLNDDQSNLYPHLVMQHASRYLQLQPICE